MFVETLHQLSVSDAAHQDEEQQDFRHKDTDPDVTSGAEQSFWSAERPGGH